MRRSQFIPARNPGSSTGWKESRNTGLPTPRQELKIRPGWQRARAEQSRRQEGGYDMKKARACAQTHAQQEQEGRRGDARIWTGVARHQTGRIQLQHQQGGMQAVALTFHYPSSSSGRAGGRRNRTRRTTAAALRLPTEQCTAAEREREREGGRDGTGEARIKWAEGGGRAEGEGSERARVTDTEKRWRRAG